MKNQSCFFEKYDKCRKIYCCSRYSEFLFKLLAKVNGQPLAIACWGIFDAFVVALWFSYKNDLFKIFFRKRYLRVLTSLNPDKKRLPVLIWVQTVCKSSQQTTSKELTFIILARPDDNIISSRTL